MSGSTRIADYEHACLMARLALSTLPTKDIQPERIALAYPF